MLPLITLGLIGGMKVNETHELMPKLSALHDRVAGVLPARKKRSKFHAEGCLSLGCYAREAAQYVRTPIVVG